MSRRDLLALGASCIAGLPAAANASGFSFGENGVKALSMGGAFTGQADDLSAIDLNPAGLQQLEGFHFLLDGQLLSESVTFQRTDAVNTQVNSVSNTGAEGPFSFPSFIVPFASLGYGTMLDGRRLTIAIGVYGPPAIGHFQYPQPEQQQPNGTYANDPRVFAPQRYALISSNTVLAYPTLSVAYAIHPRFAAGLSLQYVYADIQFVQDVTTFPFTEQNKVALEDPNWDSLVTAHFTGKPNFTGVLGLMARPFDKLQFGASLRPPIVINATGTLDIALGPTPRQFASVTGDSAALEFVMPMEIRFGAHYEPIPAVGVNADVIYEGWHRLQSLAITPVNIVTQTGNEPPTPLAPFNIVKDWHDTVGVRAGGSYRFAFGLEARAGILYEQAAAPTAYTNIDFPHLSQVMLTAGAGYPFGPVEVLLTAAWVSPSHVTVALSQSQVVQTNTNAGVPGDVVGAGTYSTSGWIAGLGIRGKFGTPSGSTAPSRTSP
jgi:long-chain fatty acid transport protein